MNVFASMFPEKGFTCIQTDLTMPSSPAVDSEALMHHFESRKHSSASKLAAHTIHINIELSKDIRLAAIPFPPVLFARASACIIAQTYISSNPATGLFLISPPPTNTAAKGPLPTVLKEFDFEAKFPIAVMASSKDMDILKESRLGSDIGVDKIEVAKVDGQEAFVAIEQWLDELGI